MRGEIIRINFQNFLRLRHRVANTLRLRINLGKPLHDHGRSGLKRQCLLIKVDRFGSLFGPACQFVLLLIQVAHREVVVKVCASALVSGIRAGFGSRSGSRCCLSAGSRGGFRIGIL